MIFVCGATGTKTVPCHTLHLYRSIILMTLMICLFCSQQQQKLIQELSYTPLLQLDATYKVTWNELPLLIFGSSDANTRFRPFGAALVSTDESSSCYETLFTSLHALSLQELHKPYSKGITCAQQRIFPHANRLMCWFHVMKNCRLHPQIPVTKNQWNEIDKQIHAIQLELYR